MNWWLVVIRIAQASLILGNFEDDGAGYQRSRYSKHEIEIEGTAVRLNGKVLHISGLSNQRYLLCFREGNLIFPNAPADQTVEHELAVEEGDWFAWFGGPVSQSFLDGLRDRFTEDEIDKTQVYSFRILTERPQIKSKLIPYRRLGCVAGIVVGTLLAFGFTFGILFLVNSLPAPPGPSNRDLCLRPDTFVSYFLEFLSNDSYNAYESMHLLVDKNCSNFTFEWNEHNQERAMQCLQRWTGISDWILTRFDPNPSISSDWPEFKKCPEMWR